MNIHKYLYAVLPLSLLALTSCVASAIAQEHELTKEEISERKEYIKENFAVALANGNIVASGTLSGSATDSTTSTNISINQSSTVEASLTQKVFHAYSNSTANVPMSYAGLSTTLTSNASEEIHLFEYEDKFVLANATLMSTSLNGYPYGDETESYTYSYVDFDFDSYVNDYIFGDEGLIFGYEETLESYDDSSIIGYGKDGDLGDIRLEGEATSEAGGVSYSLDIEDCLPKSLTATVYESTYGINAEVSFDFSYPDSLSIETPDLSSGEWVLA
ncbi:MAG: hypothetical protein Q4F15_01755 [Bacillota bacterium]|nr:hypothetical protein [Bacillota bacterium]